MAGQAGALGDGRHVVVVVVGEELVRPAGVRGPPPDVAAAEARPAARHEDVRLVVHGSTFL